MCFLGWGSGGRGMCFREWGFCLGARVSHLRCFRWGRLVQMVFEGIAMAWMVAQWGFHRSSGWAILLDSMDCLNRSVLTFYRGQDGGLSPFRAGRHRPARNILNRTQRLYRIVRPIYSRVLWSSIRETCWSLRWAMLPICEDRLNGTHAMVCLVGVSPTYSVYT